MDILAAVSDVQDALVSAIDAQTSVPVEFGYPVAGPRPEHIWVSDEVREITPTYVLSTGSGEPSGATFRLNVRVLVTLKGTAAEIRDRMTELAATVFSAVLPDGASYLSGAASLVTVGACSIVPGLENATRYLGADIELMCAVGVWE